MHLILNPMIELFQKVLWICHIGWCINDEKKEFPGEIMCGKCWNSHNWHTLVCEVTQVLSKQRNTHHSYSQCLTIVDFLWTFWELKENPLFWMAVSEHEICTASSANLWKYGLSVSDSQRDHIPTYLCYIKQGNYKNKYWHHSNK